MSAIASQIISLSMVYSTVYSDADHRKNQSSASLAFVRGIQRGPVNSPHKWPVTRKLFPFDDVIMFQRLDLTLYTNKPGVTTCFEYTVLTWLPVILLSVLSLLGVLLSGNIRPLNPCCQTSCLHASKKVTEVLCLYLTHAASLVHNILQTIWMLT